MPVVKALVGREGVGGGPPGDPGGGSEPKGVFAQQRQPRRPGDKKSGKRGNRVHSVRQKAAHASKPQEKSKVKQEKHCLEPQLGAGPRAQEVIRHARCTSQAQEKEDQSRLTSKVDERFSDGVRGSGARCRRDLLGEELAL